MYLDYSNYNYIINVCYSYKTSVIINSSLKMFACVKSVSGKKNPLFFVGQTSLCFCRVFFSYY